MKILVTFAVEAEFAPWRRLQRRWTVKDAVLHAYELASNEARICVILTGIGSERAWDTNAASIWGSDFDVCVSSGLAGALNPKLGIGDVVVADTVCDYKGQKPLPCDGELTEIAVRLGAKRVAAFYTSDRILVTADEKKRAMGFGDIVEMESRRVIGTAGHGFGWGSRCVGIRCISDDASEDLPVDFNGMVTHAGNVDTTKVVGHALRHPGTLPALISFGRRSRLAAKSLAAFLDEYVVSLGKMARVTSSFQATTL